MNTNDNDDGFNDGFMNRIFKENDIFILFLYA